jgi:uncharacterized protein involved in outer membrane biogenesis
MIISSDSAGKKEVCTMRGKRKILIIIAGVLVVVIAAAIILILTNIDSIVKAAIEKYGSEATKTAVRVSSVKIHVTSGEGAIAGLTVANPHGFNSPYVFRLGKISTRIDTRSITSSPIVIDEIRIAAPQVTYEMNSSGASNISLLKQNLQAPAASTPKKTGEEKKDKGKEKKIIIKRFVIESGRIDVRIAALGDKTETLTLRRIELTNIGKPGGATPAQVSQQVLSALVDEVGRVVQSLVKKNAEKGIDRAIKRYLSKPR